MSGSGKGLLGLWLYRSGEHEWAVKEGSPLHKVAEVSNFYENQMSAGKRFLNILKFKEPKTAQVSKPVPLNTDRTSLVFTLNNQVGGLARVLQIFQELGINVLFIEFQHYNEEKQQVQYFLDKRNKKKTLFRT